MPSTTVQTTATTIYTSDRGTANSPDTVTVKNPPTAANSVAILTIFLGDTTYSDGVEIEPGESYTVDLRAEQSLVLAADGAPTDVNYHVVRF